MKKETNTRKVVKEDMNDILREALELLEKEDGKPFEEKKEELVNFLREKAATMETVKITKAFDVEAERTKINQRFWVTGNVQTSDRNIILRPVQDSDREGFMKVKREYFEIKAILENESFQNSLWEDHMAEKTLMLSIEHGGKYIGYCGIHDTTCDLWEIAIELQLEWTGRGIGVVAMTAMLDAIKSRLSVNKYKVRIEPSNYASQSLFERLGAKPRGVAKLWIHDPKKIEQCEEENLHMIDEALVAVADKFGVAPRKLLSHVLEYTLDW